MVTFKEVQWKRLDNYCWEKDYPNGAKGYLFRKGRTFDFAGDYKTFKTSKHTEIENFEEAFYECDLMIDKFVKEIDEKEVE